MTPVYLTHRVKSRGISCRVCTMSDFDFEIYCGHDYHLGHVVLEHLKLHTDTIFQIDAATGHEETYSSVLRRSVRLARALRNYGLEPGDVLAVGGTNIVHLHIPMYSALYNGLPSVGIDPYFKYDEIRTLFDITKPKIVFCQNENVDVYNKAAKNLGLDIKMITFDGGDCTMSSFVKKYDTNKSLKNFKVLEIDVDYVNAFLVTTSGTEGKLKVAAINHKPFILKWVAVLQMVDLDKIHKKTLIISPVHCISTYFTLISTPLTGDTKIQTSKPDDIDHIVDVINKYKPRNALLNPSVMEFLLNRKDVDLESFRSVTVSGSKIRTNLFDQFRSQLSNEAVSSITYGQTEVLGPVLMPNPSGPLGTCGKPIPFYDVKLFDLETKLEIKESYVSGELLVKGPCFTEYYQDPEETARVFTPDGYFKTGDFLYRDEKNNYFFVDRITALLKCRYSEVIPIQIETVIREHPSVNDVCVIGIPDPEDGDHPVACVVLQPGEHANAQDLKDLVKRKLSNNKQLRGGVVFLKAFPLTSTGKIARKKLLQLVMNSTRE